MTLTPKQEAFARAYVETGNASEALSSTCIIGNYKRKPQGYYVYVLIDPRFDRIFYVGKGKGGRLNHHVRDARRGRVSGTLKSREISEIIADGYDPVAIVLDDGLAEDTALRCEAALINRLGRARLTNSVSGAQHPLVHQFERLMAVKSCLRKEVPAQKVGIKQSLERDIKETAEWIISLMKREGLEYVSRAGNPPVFNGVL